jgi:hypothetical protein
VVPFSFFGERSEDVNVVQLHLKSIMFELDGEFNGEV